MQLKKVESEYTMYFSGRTARPPVESRAALDRAFKRFDRVTFESAITRFQFTTLQARYSTFCDLWDRSVRAKEEGRSTPFVKPSTPAATPSSGQVLHTAVFHDPLQETDKLHELYEALMQARREEGLDVVPFHRFAGLVRDQMRVLQERHPGDEVRFLVTRHDGKVGLTARAVKVGTGSDRE
ncbi:MAG: hypothetical protein IT182_07120 [Acidobacteria bacterium]|nr:hypothetical protein [Acidobacteriota bacterium]